MSDYHRAYQFACRGQSGLEVAQQLLEFPVFAYPALQHRRKSRRAFRELQA